MSQTWKKRTIALGGTFDHFHAGHQRFIKFAAQQGGALTIGVTSEQLTRHKPLAELIQPFNVRKRAVIQFCNRERIKCQVVPLNDRFGPALTDPEIFGLAVTEQNLATGRELVETRKKLGLRPLETFVCPLLKTDSGEVISSSHIRAGHSNRLGIRYATAFESSILLNDDQKKVFSKPQGDVVDQPMNSLYQSKVLVVGDTSLEQFINNAWSYHVGVFDLRKQRQPVVDSTLLQIHRDASVQNPAGSITPELTSCLNKALNTSKNPYHVFVDGEEDLAAVALVLLSPLETQIYYGQPEQGLVLMTVTEALKERVFNRLMYQNEN